MNFKWDFKQMCVGWKPEFCSMLKIYFIQHSSVYTSNLSFESFVTILIIFTVIIEVDLLSHMAAF